MHFFNFEGMVADLKADRITESDYFKYLFGYFVLLRFPHEAVVSLLGHESSSKPPSVLIQIVIFVIGLALLYWIFSGFYRLNRGDRGKQFFVRYFLLSWVVGLRSMAIGLPIVLLALLFLKEEVPGRTSTLVFAVLVTMVVVAAGASLYYFIKMREGFRRLGDYDWSMALKESVAQ